MQKNSIYLNLIHKQTIGKIKNKFIIYYEVIIIKEIRWLSFYRAAVN